MKDNQIKFGFWNYLPSNVVDVSIVKEWKEIGCNLPMSFVYDKDNKNCTKEYMISLLDECENYGLKCLVFDTRTSFKTLNKIGEEAFIKGVKEAKDDFYSHPAVYGFLVDDEPTMEQENDYIRAYQILNEIMPDKFHFGNLHPYFSKIMDKKYGGIDERFKRVKEMVVKSGCELIAYDQYTQCYIEPEDREDGINQFLIGLSKYLEIGNELNIPVYPSLLSIGHFTYRAPTDDDIKWQMNVALTMGAKGIIWFYFHHDLIDYGFKVETAPFFGTRAEKTETFNIIKRQLEIFDVRYRKIFDDLDILKYQYFGKTIEEDKTFKGEENWITKFDLWKNDLFIISYGQLRSDSKKVAIITNASQDKVNYFTAFFNDKDSYGYWIGPGEMIVLDIEKKTRF